LALDYVYEKWQLVTSVKTNQKLKNGVQKNVLKMPQAYEKGWMWKN
jgi:hypothetical protein